MWRFNNQEKEKGKNRKFWAFFCRFVSQVLHDVSHVLHLRHLFPTAGPARNTLRSYCHCVVVASEFIMTRVVRQWL
jgi:hypothetical protein